jgi:2',3'-cyclic-nucleotide 2'-phosphodiesterase (5'-nucleotidase family)
LNDFGAGLNQTNSYLTKSNRTTIVSNCATPASPTEWTEVEKDFKNKIVEYSTFKVGDEEIGVVGFVNPIAMVFLY